MPINIKNYNMLNCSWIFFHILQKNAVLAMTVKERVEKLRRAMELKGVHAYIIPSSDPHQSEYVADYWKSREWISGFTGSAGVVVVTLYKAALWTDSRYFLQGVEQLEGTGIELMKQGMPGVPSKEDWLAGVLEAGQIVACDGNNFSVSQIRALSSELESAHLALDYKLDLFADAWEDRPALPKGDIFEHLVKFAGKNRKAKIAEVREGMDGADGHLITTLDDIAWLLNLRGNDVECNPVAIAHCMVEQERVCLFVDDSKISASLKKELNGDGIQLMPYEQTEDFISNLYKGYQILIDPNTVNANLYDAIPDTCLIHEGKTVSTFLKAIKNKTEVGHIKEAMAKDAVALLKLFRWMETELPNRQITEVEVSDQLIEFRKEGADYYGESFPAIVGYKGNGAIVHYRPMPDACASMKNEGMLLLDSGGQYHNGTTDITRTVIFGEATKQQKEHFTLVLKGHIALATQHFPDGTTGLQLDTLTRQHLWKQNLNFGHGTGHGVGFFLNVHEGPQGIGPVAVGRYLEKIREGMFMSNEPGLYLTDEYGIRIENLILAVDAGDNGFGKFLKFDTLTLFPIDLNLVDNTMLSYEEKKWLNDYHQETLAKVAPLLDNEDDINWLKNKCRMV